MSWYNMKKSTEYSPVLSTRIRLARNIKGIPFPSKMTAEQLNNLCKSVKKAIEQSELPIAKELKFFSMEDITENERFCMAERHIISPEFAKRFENRAVVLSKDETVSIMIGEEDHIRIQVIMAGENLEKCYKIADLIDDMLCSALKIAYDKRLGFLTECPTNLGTGMRASVMLHLPLMYNSGALKRFSDSASKIGYTVRGMYGEGSSSDIPVFQISNQITLGLDEKSAVQNLKSITENLIKTEKQKEKEIEKIKLADMSLRAFATLKYARILSSRELGNLISQICIGISSGAVKADFDPLALFIEGQPYTVMKKYGNISAAERDIKRGETVRNLLKEKDAYEI